jgi:hypothetical protein
MVWSAAALLALAGVSLWLAFDPCYCYWHDEVNHVKSLSPGCEAVFLPEPWRYPNGNVVLVRFAPYDERTQDTFEDFEFRKSSAAADEVLVALVNRPAVGEPVPPHRTSQQRYAFRFPALIGHPERRISGLRLVSELDWVEAAVMPLSASGPAGDEAPFQEFTASGGPILHAGRRFEKTENYYWDGVGWPAILSPGGRLLAVMSYGPRKHEGNAAGDPFALNWHRYTADLYAVAGGQRVGQVRFWGCGGELRDAEWHGDTIFSLPLDDGAQSFIVCGFR